MGAPAHSRLLIVRHGATANNAEGRYTGHSPAPLSPLGHQQAEALAARLAATPIQSLVSSDLPRAIETARVLAAYQTCDVILDPDLREVSLGQWEGLSPARARQRDPEAFAAWHDDPLEHAPPGGETVMQLAMRVRRAWRKWITAAEQEATTVWVTHGGVISVVLCDVLGLSLTERGRFRRDNASITEIAYQRGEIVLVRLNDTAHLETLDTALVEARQVL